jgi:PHD/YefM family antitoxin component YafN of YafNO toxin-antitoxin module
MSMVNHHGCVAITHRKSPEAVVLSLNNYMALARAAHRACEYDSSRLAELRSRFDQRLASLSNPQAHQAIHRFMDEAVALQGEVRAGADGEMVIDTRQVDS